MTIPRKFTKQEHSEYPQPGCQVNRRAEGQDVAQQNATFIPSFNLFSRHSNKVCMRRSGRERVHGCNMDVCGCHRQHERDLAAFH